MAPASSYAAPIVTAAPITTTTPMSLPVAPSMGYDLAPQVFISGGGGMYVPAPGAEAASTFDVGNFVPATGIMVSGGGKMYMPSAAAVPMGTFTGMTSPA